MPGFFIFTTMKYFYLLIFFLSHLSFAQNATFKTNKEFREHAKQEAKQHIIALKNSVVIVRLTTKSATIKRLESQGNYKHANTIRQEVTENNLKIVKAMRDGFTFCPIYFFPDTCSKAILNNHYDSVVFYNDSLTIDSTLTMNFTSFYIVELGFTESSKDEYYKDRPYVKSDKGGTKTNTKVYGGTNLSVPGFVIRDSKFNQLRKPFPYYVKVFEKYPTTYRYFKKIVEWNLKLQKFYDRNTV